MGQGHCVAAIDTVNLLLDNMLKAHSERYSLTDEGLTRYVRDFYSYRLGADGKQDSPLGSHVNAHTAGGMAEGGYLGFVELEYIHMPLPGESLVVFLSDGAYPVRLPYGVAVAPKGAGFYGQGTSLAHNLPLGENPHTNVEARQHFNESARRLWVPAAELRRQVGALQHHDDSHRPRERDHSLMTRNVKLEEVPRLVHRPVPADRRDMSTWLRTSPMYAVDTMLLAIVQANPHLRPRVGNPDEMKSNRLTATLDHLKFRVTDPEPTVPEDVHGAIITALNEEAVEAAARVLGEDRRSLLSPEELTALDGLRSPEGVMIE